MSGESAMEREKHPDRMKKICPGIWRHEMKHDILLKTGVEILRM